MLTSKVFTHFICLSAFVFGAAFSAREHFLNFKERYNKAYANSVEETKRFEIFVQNKQLIEEHNKQYRRGVETYSLTLNEYADWTPAEFQVLSTGSAYKDYLPFEQFEYSTFEAPKGLELPTAIDWRDLGAVTAVKKQLRCGSCWAFAATGALEAQNYRKTGQLTSLSEQNLIDCTTAYDNHGCQGGNKEMAFRYVRDNGGIDTELSYPYLARQNTACYYNASSVGGICTGFIEIPAEDEYSLMAAVAILGPVAVALNGHCLKWQFYEHGIFSDPACKGKHLTHAVLIVGYGRNVSTEAPYWIVKNSWGADWGMEGFVLVPRLVNFAGIAERASVPLI